jgi:hypothetical protein
MTRIMIESVDESVENCTILFGVFVFGLGFGENVPVKPIIA